MKKPHPQGFWLKAIAAGETLEEQTSSGWSAVPAAAFLGASSRGESWNRTLRVKPNTITIGGREIVEPVREDLPAGTIYYYLKLDAVKTEWTDRFDKELVLTGVCFLTERDAVMALNAFRAALKGEGNV